MDLHPALEASGEEYVSKGFGDKSYRAEHIDARIPPS